MINANKQLGVSPYLGLGDGYDIAEGVLVWPIEYPQHQSNPPFKSTVFVVEPGKSTPQDNHQVEEMWVILEGTGLLSYETETLRVSSMDQLFFPSLKTHQISNDASRPLKILSIYWST